MNNFDIDKLKIKITNFIQDVNNMQKDVNNLIDTISSTQESLVVEEKIKLLKEMSAALTMDSTIEELLKIDGLLEEIHKMVFDLDYVISGDIPEYIAPSVDSIYVTVDGKKITALAKGVKDPQQRLKDVKYRLCGSTNILIQEQGGLQPLYPYSFKEDIESGSYYVQGIFSYIGKMGERTLEVTSQDIVINEEEVIIPIIDSLAVEVVNNKNVAVMAKNINDPQKRLLKADYFLFDNSDSLVEGKEEQDVASRVQFRRDLEPGQYIALGEFTYQDRDGTEVISINSAPITVEGEESFIASVNLTSINQWENGFNGNLEVKSHTSQDFGGEWELTFETALESFSHWQIATSLSEGIMKVSSGTAWNGSPHFTLPPQGSLKVEGISANGAPFNREVIKNCKLNGNKVRLYIDGEAVNEGAIGEFSFPEDTPISGSIKVSGLAVSDNNKYLMGTITIPEPEIYDRYAVYHNSSKVREEDIVSLKGEETKVNIQVPMSSLPINSGVNKLSVAFKNTKEKIYESNEVNYVVAAPDRPEKKLVGYWSSWGGNGPTSYVDLEDVPAEYTTVVVSFIEHEGDNITPKFDPTDSGQVTDQEFMEKVKTLQNRGVKVVIAIGGQNGVFKLKSAADKEKFKSGVIRIIEKYGFDGYDIDLEGGSIGGSADYSLMVEATREIVEYFRGSNPEFIYSMAPEVAYLITSGFGNFYIRLIKEQMDLISYIHPQYYNAPGTGVFKMDGSGVMVETSNDSIMQQEFITEFTHALTLGHDGAGWGQDPAQSFPIGRIPEEKLIIGLPAGTGAAGTGAIDNMESIKTAWNNIVARGIHSIKGFMTWSIDWDKYHKWQFKNMVDNLENR
ncbi:hypothetical protein PM10SUCC1_04900 [Propionigenium maris DSM 9537]|uniref:GH18 domain-containing protein n=1 Tax=Propionigenium maris DSM 9537 TaxID=1123000 RepID=A0A9W6GJ84_9FUSO|nr:glycosyl hydrolase family 18 protein [Propionigenium maris]GLI54975.1 hypothetical protein PM10SUCC1_04900 [Propionigenium maris DSM 9537]